VALSLPRPAAVNFDLDGTLVDTVSARIGGWVEALRAAGLGSAPEVIGPKIGMDGKRLAREVAEAAGRTLSDQEVEAIDKAAGEAFDRRNGSPRLLPGVQGVVVALASAGVPWLIATSSRAAQVTRSVAALGFAQEPPIVDGSHVQHAKPAPDLLLLAAARLGVEPGRCWAVGDATWDVRAAVAAGMTAIGVTAGSAVTAAELEAAGTAAVLGSLEELPGLLAPG